MRNLRSEDFFDAAAHPTAVLKITRIEPGANGQYAAAGELTLRGVTKSLELPVTVKRFGEGALTVEGETVIKRKDFGINYDSAFNPIKNEVKVLYRLHLLKP